MRRNVKIRKRLMTLVEISVASVVVSIMTLGISASMIQNMKLMYAGTFRTAAITLCQQRLEEVKAQNFDDLVPTNVVENGEVLTHTYSPDKVDIQCSITTIINDVASTASDYDMSVYVKVEWTYRGRTSSEEMSAIVYRF